jgi:hypothetical protein
MSIIGALIALFLLASGAYVIVSAIPGPAVSSTSATVSGTLPRPPINRSQSVRSGLTARTDQEELRRYFLQGLPDGPRRISP